MLCKNIKHTKTMHVSSRSERLKHAIACIENKLKSLRFDSCLVVSTLFLCDVRFSSYFHLNCKSSNYCENGGKRLYNKLADQIIKLNAEILSFAFFIHLFSFLFICSHSVPFLNFILKFNAE